MAQPDYSEFARMITAVNTKLASGLEPFTDKLREQKFSLETKYIPPPEGISVEHQETLQKSLETAESGLEINSLKIIPITGKEYSKVRLCLREEAANSFIVVEFYVDVDGSKPTPGYLLTRKVPRIQQQLGKPVMRRQCFTADFGNVDQKTVSVERLYIRDNTDPASNSSSLDCDTDYIDDNPTGKDPIYDLASPTKPAASRVRSSVRKFNPNPVKERKDSALADIMLAYPKIKKLLQTVHGDINRYLTLATKSSGPQNREHVLAILLDEAKKRLNDKGAPQIVDAYITLIKELLTSFTSQTAEESSGGGSRVSKKRRKAKRGGARSNKKRKSAVKSRKRGLSKNKRGKHSRKALRRK